MNESNPRNFLLEEPDSLEDALNRCCTALHFLGRAAFHPDGDWHDDPGACDGAYYLLEGISSAIKAAQKLPRIFEPSSTDTDGRMGQ